MGVYGRNNVIFLCLIQIVNRVLTDLRLLAEAFQTAAQTD